MFEGYLFLIVFFVLGSLEFVSIFKKVEFLSKFLLGVKLNYVKLNKIKRLLGVFVKYSMKFFCFRGF